MRRPGLVTVRFPRARGARRGVVMMVVLWFVVLMTIIAVSLAYEMRVSMKMTSQAVKRLRARGLAQAGMAKAVADLRNNTLMNFAGQIKNQVPSHDTLDGVWAQVEDKTDVELGEGIYTVRIVDEDRKLDLNLIQPQNREAFQYLLETVCEIEREDAAAISFAVLDFKDMDLQPLQGEGLDEVEAYTNWGIDKYERMLPEEWIFRPKNDFYLSLEELLEIPGITREMVYGVADKTSQDPIEHIDLGEDEPPALSDFLTVGRSGQVNVNTCPQQVFEAILYAATHGSAEVEGLANRLIDFREDAGGNRAKEASGITRLEELDQSGVDPALLQAMKGMFPLGVSSFVFTVYSRGEFAGVRETIAARVRVYMEVYPIDPDNPDRIGKRDENAMGELRSSMNQRVDPTIRIESVWEM